MSSFFAACPYVYMLFGVNSLTKTTGIELLKSTSYEDIVKFSKNYYKYEYFQTDQSYCVHHGNLIHYLDEPNIQFCPSFDPANTLRNYFMLENYCRVVEFRDIHKLLCLRAHANELNGYYYGCGYTKSTFKVVALMKNLLVEICKEIQKRYFKKNIAEELMAKIWHPKNMKRFRDWGIDVDE